MYIKVSLFVHFLFPSIHDSKLAFPASDVIPSNQTTDCGRSIVTVFISFDHFSINTLLIVLDKQRFPFAVSAIRGLVQ
jgi:hypothetical protein